MYAFVENTEAVIIINWIGGVICITDKYDKFKQYIKYVTKKYILNTTNSIKQTNDTGI